MSSEQTACVNSLTVIICNIIVNTAIGPDLSVLNYSWYYNNSKIQDEKLSKDGIFFTTNLTLGSIQHKDSGVYKCKANIVGSNEIKTNLTDIKIIGI